MRDLIWIDCLLKISPNRWIWNVSTLIARHCHVHSKTCRNLWHAAFRYIYCVQHNYRQSQNTRRWMERRQWIRILGFMFTLNWKKCTFYESNRIKHGELAHMYAHPQGKTKLDTCWQLSHSKYICCSCGEFSETNLPIRTVFHEWNWRLMTSLLLRYPYVSCSYNELRIDVITIECARWALSSSICYIQIQLGPLSLSICSPQSFSFPLHFYVIVDVMWMQSNDVKSAEESIFLCSTTYTNSQSLRSVPLCAFDEQSLWITPCVHNKMRHECSRFTGTLWNGNICL